MQVIIPTAGLGTRLRPHTHSKAKPLVHVAGKPVLAHILDELKKVDVSEIIFVVGYLGDQIEKFVTENYDFKTRFVVQQELKGQAHAINLAKSYIKEDVIIWFVDTISDQDLTKIKDVDGLIYVKKHEEPERMGIVFPDDNGVIKKIVEKPENPESNLANIGVFYVKDYKLLFDSIDHLIKHDMQTKGEFYLVDAFNLMIEKGYKFKAAPVKVWEDCGNRVALLKTNRYLLDKEPGKNKPSGNVIVEPVFIEEGATVENSIIGPYVSIAKGCVVKNSNIKNSIISTNAQVKDAQLKDSLIGDRATVKGFFKSLNIGDDSQIIYGNEDKS